MDTGPFNFGDGTDTPDERPLSFEAFIRRVNPRYRFYAHARRLVTVLQRVADGEIRRLMIFMPPRHSKSETASRLFAAYYLYRYPQRFVALTSYGAELAHGLSRAARDNFLAAGGVIREDAAAVKYWETAQGGGLWATGVGGAATGRGFHVGIIDDPLKNAEEAASQIIREKQWEWYQSVFSTREEPGGATVVIQTRWHEDDLSGRLLAQEAAAAENAAAGSEGWHIVHMAAIAEEPPVYPISCTLEPDSREPGSALCPPRYDVTKLAAIRRRIGSRFWSALYQQRPAPLEGGLFKRSWFKVLANAPSQAWRARYWDKAVSTSANAKYTAGVRIAITPAGDVVIEHVIRGQWSTGERRKVMRQAAEMDAAQFGSVLVYIEQEPGSSGVDSVQDEIRLLAGHPVFADRPSGDKDTRMLPLAAQAEAGNVYLLAGAWNDDFVDELCAIPNGRYRDQADAAGGAFNRLIEVINAQPDGSVVHDEVVTISPY